MLTWIGFQFQKKAVQRYLDSLGFKSGNVLDVGCGYGWYSRLFIKNYNYVGIDADDDILARAKTKHPGVHFEKMNATELKFPDQHFDLIFCNFVLHHLTDKELLLTVKEMLRVTKAGGHILLFDLILPRCLKLPAQIFFWLDRGAKGRTFESLYNLFIQADSPPGFKLRKRFLIWEIAIFDIIK
jgi:ubiquinone/menaquinone biosynthesis C-methylase UbiE